MIGIAISRWDVPDELMAGLQDRLTIRGDEPEIQFLFRRRPRLLPVWCHGQLQVLPWAGWCPVEELEQWRGSVRVDIPASFCLEGSVWYQVDQGVRGAMVRGQVWPITQPASHYFKVMTRSDRMPLVIGQQF